MKKHIIHTAHVYRKHENTDRFAIEVAIDNYNDVFNEWDPAPFKRRSLNPELQYFLEECSNDISIKYPLAIVFYMPSIEHVSEKETFCIDGIHTHFAFMLHVLEKDQRDIMVNVCKNAAIGIVILCSAVIFDAQPIKSFFLQVLGQGLFIGGWVFIWEALATVGFRNSDLLYKKKELKRFLDAPVVFKNEHLPEQFTKSTTLSSKQRDIS